VGGRVEDLAAFLVLGLVRDHQQAPVFMLNCWNRAGAIRPSGEMGRAAPLSASARASAGGWGAAGGAGVSPGFSARRGVLLAAVRLHGVDEVAASGVDPQVGLAGRCAHEDLDLVEALEHPMEGPAVGDPLAEGAGELAEGGRADAVPVRAGGVEVDAIDAALTE